MNSYVRGFDGRVDFSLVPQGGMPVPGKTYHEDVLQYKKPHEIEYGSAEGTREGTHHLYYKL